MILPKNFTPFKPATLENLEDLDKTTNYYIQPKIDGLRCIVVSGKMLSNTLKPFPNKKLKDRFGSIIEYTKSGLWDGELWIKGKTIQDVQSAVMSEDGDVSEVSYVVFDRVINSVSFLYDYESRHGWLEFAMSTFDFSNVIPISYYYKKHNYIPEIECEFVKQGYEGIIIRNPNSSYKFGRATLKENSFFKFKRTEDAEARIVDTIELKVNHNDKTFDDRGYAKRSSHKHNKYSTSIAGSLEVVGVNGKYKDKVFKVSLSSCTMPVRHWYWLNRNFNKGRVITYIMAKHRGTDLAPAEPRIKCFRSDYE